MFPISIFFNNFLIYILVFFGITLLLFFIARNIFVWYLKINKVLKYQNFILEKLENLENSLSNLSKVQTNLQSANFQNYENATLDSKTDDCTVENIFKNTKNIIVHDVEMTEKNVFSYFRAKQYAVILIDKSIQDFKSYKNIMLVQEKIDLIYIKCNFEKLAEILKECLARKKLKGDVKYVWIENQVIDQKNGIDKIFETFSENKIGVILGKNLYSEYVNLAMQK